MDEFEKYFATSEDLMSEMNAQLQKTTKNNVFNAPKKRAGSIGNNTFSQYNNIYEMMKDFNDIHSRFSIGKK